jgi:hypothetical protein
VKQKRFSVEQIVAVLKQAEAGQAAGHTLTGKGAYTVREIVKQRGLS